MNRFSRLALSFVAATALSVVSVSAASAKPHKNGSKTVVHTKKGKKVVVVERGGKATVRYGKKAPVQFNKRNKFAKGNKRFKQQRGTPIARPKVVLGNRRGARFVSTRSVSTRTGRWGHAARVTRSERRKIARAETKLARMQSRYWADGVLSNFERRALSKQQFKLQRVIDRAYRS